jgi:hypothetical protein
MAHRTGEQGVGLFRAPNAATSTKGLSISAAPNRSMDGGTVCFSAAKLWMNCCSFAVNECCVLI